MFIRDACPNDADALAAIYNDAVENTTAIWNEHTVDAANRIEWLAARQAQGYPVRVVVEGDECVGDEVTTDDGDVLGYATFGDWRAFDGFRHTVEHSVYVRADQRGRGLGRLLMDDLIPLARACDKHVMVAAIEAGNTGSIRLHEQLGFVHAGVMPQVGTKFGRWLDLAWMQLTLDDAASPPEMLGVVDHYVDSPGVDAAPRKRVVDFAELPAPEPYRLLTALVIPRPIAWVSTRSADGVDNLAPHSFFTVASADPAIVQFTSVGRKDTLRNIEATGEFVANLAPASLLQEMNATAATVEGRVDEFELAGLTKDPSATVAPPRVAASPAALECALERIIPVGDSFIVLGRVLAAAVDESALIDGRPAEWVLDPVARLSGSRYVTYGETVSLPRPE